MYASPLANDVDAHVDIGGGNKTIDVGFAAWEGTVHRMRRKVFSTTLASPLVRKSAMQRQTESRVKRRYAIVDVATTHIARVWCGRTDKRGW